MFVHHMCAGACRVQMRASDPLAAELQMVVSTTWVLGTTTQSSARMVYFRVSLPGLRLARESSKTHFTVYLGVWFPEVTRSWANYGFLIRWYDRGVMKTGNRTSLEEVGTWGMYLGLYLVPSLCFRSDTMWAVPAHHTFYTTVGWHLWSHELKSIATLSSFPLRYLGQNNTKIAVYVCVGGGDISSYSTPPHRSHQTVGHLLCEISVGYESTLQNASISLGRCNCHARQQDRTKHPGGCFGQWVREKNRQAAGATHAQRNVRRWGGRKVLERVLGKSTVHLPGGVCVTLGRSILRSSCCRAPLLCHLFVALLGVRFWVSFNVILWLPGCKSLSITKA